MEKSTPKLFIKADGVSQEEIGGFPVVIDNCSDQYIQVRLTAAYGLPGQWNSFPEEHYYGGKWVWNMQPHEIYHGDLGLQKVMTFPNLASQGMRAIPTDSLWVKIEYQIRIPEEPDPLIRRCVRFWRFVSKKNCWQPEPCNVDDGQFLL